MSATVKKGLVLAGVLAGFVSTASADALTITGGFVTNVEPVFVTAGIIMVGIGAIWSIKKVIALANKS